MSFADVRKKLAEKMANPVEDDQPKPRPCLACRIETAYKILSDLGGRCQHCFDAYCARPPVRRRQREPGEEG